MRRLRVDGRRKIVEGMAWRRSHSHMPAVPVVKASDVRQRGLPWPVNARRASIRPAGERARDSQAPGWLELDRCHLDRPAAFARAVCVPLALPRIIMAASVHVSRTERGRLFLFLMRGRPVFLVTRL